VYRGNGDRQSQIHLEAQNVAIPTHYCGSLVNWIIIARQFLELSKWLQMEKLCFEACGIMALPALGNTV